MKKRIDMSDAHTFADGLRAAWRREMWTLRTYQALAAREASATRRDVLLKLAANEQTHAERWSARLQELGIMLPPYSESWRDRLRRWVLVQTGTDSALKRLEDAEDQDVQAYEQLAASAPNDADRATIAAVQADEERHSRLLSSPAPAPSNEPQALLDVILRRERWHTRSGGWIGQAIYGANDGLGAVFGIVSGVAGATGGSHVVLLSGLAGMLASALSMGSGAYLATKSEREIYEAEMQRERKELELHPEEEQEELALFYQLKGFSPEEAASLASRLAAQPDQALKMLAHEELGLSEATFPNPWKAAISATLSTATGAFIPIIPFFFGQGWGPVIASFVVSTLAHFGIGAAKTIVTGRSPWKSGMEMTLVGVGEAAITYVLGLAFGHVIS
jgi:VIT1/CCC1 family predicted Fe2+/Mn2+ transporter/rubrerythrin